MQKHKEFFQLIYVICKHPRYQCSILSEPGTLNSEFVTLRLLFVSR